MNVQADTVASCPVPFGPKSKLWRPTSAIPKPRYKNNSIEVTGCLGEKAVVALVDCGAEGNFIHEQLVNEIEIKYSRPLNQTVLSLDGHSILLASKKIRALRKRRVRDKKELKIPLHLKTGKCFPVTVTAGSRRSMRHLNEAKTIEMDKRKRAHDAHTRAKKVRRATIASYEQLRVIISQVHDLIRNKKAALEPESDDMEDENSTTPVKWEEPYHFLELNKIIKG
ncbi:BgTH12-02448 [Blumeria graminis f. sp. triticale]|uniref:BgtAc-31528 n=3 Tax=Blumeria graminis TaxID=34373 RepID=A0A9X9MHI0_BLUGR|nr:hypothetical protein BGT96224_Ac31528 [Blumeria graminis f. sp. tritici 96224]CAD6502209.1 BgTH12-02448 [Blumeria graminis f. sp. triticale]VDB86253.1 BgtAc-31528 [Blumeria graminis f. sp. tritici]